MMSVAILSSFAQNSPRLFGLSCYVASAFVSIAIRRYRTAKKYLKKEHVSSTISKIEGVVQRDEGKRGILPLCIPGELASAAERIINAKRIAIITGFPCLLDYSPPTETDGPLGALAIARACLAIGKRVYIVTDQCNEDVVMQSAAAADLNSGRDACSNNDDATNTISSSPSSASSLSTDESEQILYDEKEDRMMTLESFPGGSDFTHEDDHRLFELAQNIDLVIAIERAGPSRDGTYRTMRKRDMTGIVAPLDRLITGDFKQHFSEDGYDNDTVEIYLQVHRERIKSIGIGDGGNEVGMGKVFDRVIKSTEIPNAPDIACTTAADDLITASVSNWGGYALAAAVALTATSEKYHLFNSVDEAVSKCLPNRQQETAICQRMVDAGGRDGMTAKNELMVDGMPLEKSIEVLEEIAKIALSKI